MRPAPGGREVVAAAPPEAGRLLPTRLQATWAGAGPASTLRRRTSVDLFEYQAKDLFAAHGVPILPGVVCTTADEARAAAEQLGSDGRRQGAGEDRRPRQGGRRQAGDDSRRGRREGGGDPRPRHQGPRRAPRPGHRGERHRRRSTTSRSCSTAPTAPTSRWHRSRAAWRSSSSPSSAPRRWRGSPSTRWPASTPRKAGEIADAAGFPADVREQVVDVLVKLWDAYVGEDATLVEVNPLVRTPDGRILALDGKVTLDDNADFRHPDHADARGARARPTPSSCAPRRRTSTTSSSTARSASSATVRASS